MRTYIELKFLKERLWNRYFDALNSNQGEAVCTKLYNEYQSVNEEYLVLVGRKK